MALTQWIKILVTLPIMGEKCAKRSKNFVILMVSISVELKQLLSGFQLGRQNLKKWYSDWMIILRHAESSCLLKVEFDYTIYLKSNRHVIYNQMAVGFSWSLFPSMKFTRCINRIAFATSKSTCHSQLFTKLFELSIRSFKFVERKASQVI